VKFRLEIGNATALRDSLAIVHFRTDEGTPPDAPAYPSGYSVRDIVSGRSDWATEEVAEFAEWLRDNPRLDQWARSAFYEIDAEIRNSSVWQSPLWTDD